MTPALERGLKKAMRTAVQMIASGGLTALVDALAGGLEPTTRLVVAAGWLFAVTFCQNVAETAGKIPVLLPTAGVLAHAGGGVAAVAGGTVEAVVATTGEVVGDVVDIAGRIVGDVTGQITTDHQEDA